MASEREATQQVGSVIFQMSTLERAVTRTLAEAVSRRGYHLHFANAWSITLADEDQELQEAFRSGRNYPDGKPVVWAMTWLSRHDRATKPSRVDGPTFFELALERGVGLGVSHYLLGSTPETLTKLENNIRSRFPGVKIVGTSSPPFRKLSATDLEHELAKVQACKPHIVWVGLGTPKQDKTAAYLASLYPGVFACVGAAFDYTAGNLRLPQDRLS